MFRKILLILMLTLSFPTTSLPLIRHPWAMPPTQYWHAQFNECQKGSLFLRKLFFKDSQQICKQFSPRADFLNVYISPLLDTLNNPYIRMAAVAGVVMYAWKKKREAQAAQEALKAFKLDHTIGH